jgi:Tol biopolymer transport system component
LPWLIFALITLAAVFIFLRLQNRVQPVSLWPAEDERISMFGKIGVTFNQPMNASSVEERFTIKPAITGQFQWEGNTFWFLPDQALDPTQAYQATIAPGAEAENGRKLRTALTWKVNVRIPSLVYLVLDTSGGDLWRYEFPSATRFPLTTTNNAIIDFSPSPTGNLIAYAQTNPAGGSDLWLIDRHGNDPEMLLDCREDQCTWPAWSADSEWIAYERASFNEGEGRYSPTRVWTVNRHTGETTPLYRQESAYGHSPSFSPDGQRLAFYDTVNHAIRVLELETSLDSFIPTVYPSAGAWSPTGEELAFIVQTPGTLEPHTTINIVNFNQQDVRLVWDAATIGMSFDPPQWSHDGEWIAYGARLVDSSNSKGIWVKNLSGGDPFPITDDPSATFSNYRWGPWGERLVFQGFPTSGPTSHASIWLWERSSGETQLIIENGARPEWLP